MDKIKKMEIGARFKEFAQNNFSSIDQFARAIEMKPPNLRSTYFKGVSVPGGELLIKLANLGCDIHWLLTGETYSSVMQQLSDRKKELEKELLEKDKIISKVAEAIPLYKGTKK